MRKVVIITRRIAYTSGKALDEITKIEESDRTAGNITDSRGKIHNYIDKLIQDDFESNKKEYRYPELLRRIADEDVKEIVANRRPESKNAEFKSIKSLEHPKYAPWVFKKYIAPVLDDILSKAKPYVCFQYRNGGEEIEVCFVFLDKIFGLFVNSNDEYQLFLNGKESDERLEFIKAICEDCGVENNGNNILYIHDKEWYNSGKEEVALYKRAPNYDKTRCKYKEFAEYFETIQVFTHDSLSFERIKELKFTFPEAEMEMEIIGRGYF